MLPGGESPDRLAFGEGTGGFRPLANFRTVIGSPSALTRANVRLCWESWNPDLTELVNTFEGALAVAGVKRSQVSYLYTHGTGTAQNDAAEIGAAEKVFESGVTFVATKPLTGHCQGASAGVEAVLTARSFTDGVMPSVTPVASPYHALAAGTGPRRDGLVLKSAIGMGGFNSAVVFSPMTWG